MGSVKVGRAWRSQRTLQEFERGISIAALAHLAYAIKSDFLLHEQSADGQNYSVQDTAGTRATYFNGVRYKVGACQSLPALGRLQTDSREFGYTRILENAPQELHNTFVQEPFQYLLDDVNGVARPLITCIFWFDRNFLYFTTHELVAWDHGFSIFERHLLPPEVARAQWSQYYDLDTKQQSVFSTLVDLYTSGRTESLQQTCQEALQMLSPDATSQLLGLLRFTDVVKL